MQREGGGRQWCIPVLPGILRANIDTCDPGRRMDAETILVFSRFFSQCASRMVLFYVSGVGLFFLRWNFLLFSVAIGTDIHRFFKWDASVISLISFQWYLRFYLWWNAFLFFSESYDLPFFFFLQWDRE